MGSLRRSCAKVRVPSELRFGVVRGIGRGIGVLDWGPRRATGMGDFGCTGVATRPVPKLRWTVLLLLRCFRRARANMLSSGLLYSNILQSRCQHTLPTFADGMRPRYTLALVLNHIFFNFFFSVLAKRSAKKSISDMTYLVSSGIFNVNSTRSI